MSDFQIIKKQMVRRRQRMNGRAVLTVLMLFSMLLVSCMGEGSIGPRPAQNLITVVEAYFQKYQPGPLPRLFQTTYLYDRNGALIAEFFPEGRRTWIPLARMSPHLLNATIAAEDATFYSNPGVDPRRVVAAVARNLESGAITSGASLPSA